MRKPTFSKALALLVVAVFSVVSALPIFATAIPSTSFDTLEFDKSYIFSLSLDSCMGEDGTSIGISDGSISASAISSGYERVGFTLTTDESFDPSVIGKSGSVIELVLNIPSINGFLDSAGDFMGGEVTLSVSGIEYSWSLDDVNITQGENAVRLNVRTATVLYPQLDEEEQVDDTEEKETPSEICVLGIYLKKLPSKEKASFILKEVAIEIPRVTMHDKNEIPLPFDDIGKTEMIIAVVIGVVIVSAIMIWTVVVVKKEEKKRRKKRRKKRIESQE